MMRTAMLVAVASLALAAACGGNDGSAVETPPTVLGDDNLARPRSISAEGCLTGEGERFVLTELTHAAGAAPETESYRLIGMESELRPLLGQRVAVTGTAEPERVVQVRESSPPADAAAGTGGTSGAEPRVSTVQSTRLEIHDMRVTTVDGTGSSCAG
jgi:hypothetical protein